MIKLVCVLCFALLTGCSNDDRIITNQFGVADSEHNEIVSNLPQGSTVIKYILPNWAAKRNLDNVSHYSLWVVFKFDNNCFLGNSIYHKDGVITAITCPQE